MRVLGIKSGNLGTDSQIRGLVLMGIGDEKIPSTRASLLTARDGRPLIMENYSSIKDFCSAITESLDIYVDGLNENEYPDFVVLPYNQANTLEAEVAVIEVMSSTIKGYFAQKGHQIKSMVLASKLYDYEFVDICNTCYHQLSDEDKDRLENSALKQKTLVTKGVPSNLNWLAISNAASSLEKVAEFKDLQDKKVALFSLGGKTEGNVIKFEIKDAYKLLEYAKQLKMQGFEPVFVNSPRTPSDVTDLLFEKCNELGFRFYNAKKIAQNSEEAENNFRLYGGKYKDEFEKQNERTGGNVYPAILSLCYGNGIVINTWDSFSYTSDAAVLGITSVVYAENEIDTKKRFDCKQLYDLCKQNGYIISLEDFVRDTSVKTKKMPSVNYTLMVSMQMYGARVLQEKGLVECFNSRLYEILIGEE